MTTKSEKRIGRSILKYNQHIKNNESLLKNKVTKVRKEERKEKEQINKEKYTELLCNIGPPPW